MLTPETRKYLEEVFGYTRVEDIDDLTMRCIEENAEEAVKEHAVREFYSDLEILAARKSLDYAEMAAKTKGPRTEEFLLPLGGKITLMVYVAGGQPVLEVQTEGLPGPVKVHGDVASID